MSTKQIFLASSATALGILIVLAVVFVPKHAIAPASLTDTATTTPVSGGTIQVEGGTSGTVTVTGSAQGFDLNHYLQVGLDDKTAGNYTGAAQAWTTATQDAPTNYVAFYNLGDLYQNFQVNYPLAEQNYLKVVALKPAYIDAYRSLYTLYRYQYKTNTSAAADIIATGLKNNPNNPDLLQLQAQMKSGN